MCFSCITLWLLIFAFHLQGVKICFIFQVKLDIIDRINPPPGKVDICQFRQIIGGGGGGGGKGKVCTTQNSWEACPPAPTPCSNAFVYEHYVGHYESKTEGKDQESIQSSTTPDQGYQWESDTFTIRHHKREPRGQPFPSR